MGGIASTLVHIQPSDDPNGALGEFTMNPRNYIHKSVISIECTCAGFRSGTIYETWTKNGIS